MFLNQNIYSIHKYLFIQRLNKRKEFLYLPTKSNCVTVAYVKLSSLNKDTRNYEFSENMNTMKHFLFLRPQSLAIVYPAPVQYIQAKKSSLHFVSVFQHVKTRKKK